MKTFDNFEDADFYLENLELQGKFGHTITLTPNGKYRIKAMDQFTPSTIRENPENYACVKHVEVPNAFCFDFH